MHAPSDASTFCARITSAPELYARIYLLSLALPPRVRIRVLMCFNVYPSRRLYVHAARAHSARGQARTDIFVAYSYSHAIPHVLLPRLDHVESVTDDISRKS